MIDHGLTVFVRGLDPRSKPRMKSREWHGMARTRLYRTWMDMRRRCYSPKHNSYPWYGGKGVRVCQEWFLSFLAFRDWALMHGYAKNLTIDRKDSAKNYSPDNCQWLSKSDNVRKSVRRKAL